VNCLKKQVLSQGNQVESRKQEIKALHVQLSSSSKDHHLSPLSDVYHKVSVLP